jgi:hypothetical protein
MKLSTLAACSAITLAAMTWQAPAVAGTQQDKMTTCNAAASAKNLTGDARKSFMSNCLSAHPTEAAPPMTQQERMTACNKTASARNLTGDARKSFMSDCLKTH